MALGRFQSEVLGSIMGSGEAYGLQIFRDLQDQQVRTSVGAIYTTLARLEKAGFVRSREVPGTPERGGRRKKLYRVTATGQRVLSDDTERWRQRLGPFVGAEVP